MALVERPSDRMLSAWDGLEPAHPLVALARLRATWRTAVVQERWTLERLSDDELVRSTDAPWWAYDPRTDELHRVEIS